MNLETHWNQFWFSRASTKSLSLLRITVGLVFFCKMTGIRFIFRYLPSFPYPQFPEHLFSGPQYYRYEGLSVPVPGFAWLPVPSFEVYQLLETCLAYGSIIFILGFATRLVGPAISLTYFYMQMLGQFSYHHNIFALMVVLLILGFSPCGDHFSLDALIRKARGIHIPKERLVIPLRMIQVFVVLLYLFTTLTKLNTGWITGEMIGYLHLQGRLFPGMPQWSNFPWYFGPLTILIEGFIAIGLCFKRIRPWALLVGFCFHYCIDVFMHVGTYSYFMWAVYIAFLPTDLSVKRWRSLVSHS